jgi:GNAT superfamily N-acetyltransferase
MSDGIEGMSMVVITQAESAEQIDQVRALMAEYLDFLRREVDTDVPDMDTLPPVAGFIQEIADLPGKYAPPDGRLLLAAVDGEPAGCVAFHKLEDGVCEVKRLWARPKFRGMKVGRRLVEALIGEARSAGYRTMLLSTVDKLVEARTLYSAVGFKVTEPYFDGPEEMMAHEIFMRLEL